MHAFTAHAVLCVATAMAQAVAPDLPSLLVRELGGYPLGVVNAVSFDSSGCLWVATPGGLLRFDGQRLIRFGTEEGLADLHVYDVLCDQKGRVWAGTWRGLCVGDGGRFRRVTFPGDSAFTLSPSRRLALGPDGTIWVTGDGGTLRRVHPDGITDVLDTPLGASRIATHLAIDRRGRPWVAHLHAGGDPIVGCIRDSVFALAHEVGAPLEVVQMGTSVNGLWVQEPDGTVWVESAEGFARVSLPSRWPRGHTLRSWVSTPAMRLFFGDSLVVGEFLDGAARVAVVPARGSARSAPDAEGAVWCAAYGEGMLRIGPPSIDWYEMPTHLGSAMTEHQPGGILWIGTERALHRGKIEGVSLHVVSFQTPSVTALEPLGEDSVVVGTTDGLFLVGGTPPRVLGRWGLTQGLPHRRVTTIARWGRGAWVGTMAGACEWDPARPRVRVPTQMWGLAVTALLPDGDTVWMGTWAGLGAVRGEEVIRVAAPHHVLWPAVTTLSRDASGRVMVGTYSDGLHVVRNDTLVSVSSPLTRVVAVVPRGDVVPYLLGVRALLRVEEGYRFSVVRRFDAPLAIRQVRCLEDGVWHVTSSWLERSGDMPPIRIGAHSGLPEEPILTFSADEHGDLWVLTEAHLCHVRRHLLGASPLRGRFMASVVSGEGLPVPFSGTHTLAGGTRRLTLLLAFPSSSLIEMELRTKLEPVDHEWSPWTRQWERDFAALPAGSFVLWAQARTACGRSTPPTAVGTIIVPPRWHERTTARVALGVLLVALGTLVGLAGVHAAHVRARRLEALVQERTADLDSSRAKAVAASRAKSALLSRMAHETRTPLGAMVGFASLIADSHEEGDPTHERAKVILDAGEKLLDLVKGTLDLSRAEKHALEMHHEPFDLLPTIKDVTLLLGLKAHEKGITMHLSGDAGRPLLLMGEKDRVREALINLLGNAIRFTPSGGTITVRWWADEVRGYVSIRDTGPGIAPADHAAVFEPFVRIVGETEGGGTGLGLAISKQLIEAMGGTITLESDLGEGCTFTIALPRASRLDPGGG